MLLPFRNHSLPDNHAQSEYINNVTVDTIINSSIKSITLNSFSAYSNTQEPSMIILHVHVLKNIRHTGDANAHTIEIRLPRVRM